MVKAFEFAQTPNIIFGQGKIADLPRLVKIYGGDVLVVSGKKSFTHSKHGEFVFNTFELTGIRYHHFQVNSEPSPEMIDKAVITHRPNNIGLVVAIGGGSVIDTGSFWFQKSE